MPVITIVHPAVVAVCLSVAVLSQSPILKSSWGCVFLFGGGLI